MESVLLASCQVPDEDDGDNDGDEYDNEGDDNQYCDDDGQMYGESNGKSWAVGDDQGSILRDKTEAPSGIWKSYFKIQDLKM